MRLLAALLALLSIAGCGVAQDRQDTATGLAGQEAGQETRLGGTTARFDDPTNRYGHDVLGGLPEWGRLCLRHDGQSQGLGRAQCYDLPQTSVFEDIAPRLADTNGDGVAEAIVVESSISGGASLAVYFLNSAGLTRVATPPIGQRNRWLAPVGIADLNGDGSLDIAYVETPHLGKTLTFWSVEGRSLRKLGAHQGFSNHRIGEPFITSGIRNCEGAPQVVLPDATWRRVMGVRLEGEGVRVTDLGPFEGRAALEAQLKC